MSCANVPIVVPSYKRHHTLAAKTLQVLQHYDVDMRRLHVFVADQQEHALYADVLPKEATIAVGVPGMRAIRNFIAGYFPEGQPLLCLDDDILGLYQKVDDKRFVPLDSLDRMVREGFAACDAASARLWGIYPVLNAMFMKHRTTTDLRYIVGCAWGVYNAKAIQVTVDDKEDFERTLLFYQADGRVVRLESIAPKTVYYREPGGMQVERTEQRVQESAAYLVQKFPHLCTLNTTKASGHWEVRLRDKRPRAGAAK